MRFLRLGDSSLDLEPLVCIPDPDLRRQFRVKSDLLYGIEAALNKAGIEIPFPQRDSHILSVALRK